MNKPLSYELSSDVKFDTSYEFPVVEAFDPKGWEFAGFTDLEINTPSTANTDQSSADNGLTTGLGNFGVSDSAVLTTGDFDIDSLTQLQDVSDATLSFANGTTDLFGLESNPVDEVSVSFVDIDLSNKTDSFNALSLTDITNLDFEIYDDPVFANSVFNPAEAQVSSLFGQYPNLNASAGDLSFGDRRPPTKADQQAAKYARFAQLAYDQPAGQELEIPEGYVEIAAEWTGVNSFQGRAFYNEQTNEVVIAFGGTQLSPNDPGDLVTDARLFLGQTNNQVIPALAFVEQVNEQLRAQGIEPAEVVYTGHSLGGATATEVAALLRINEGETNYAVVVESAGSLNSLKNRLGRELTEQELRELRASQINYRTNTPISGPDNPVAGTKGHFSTIVDINIERSPTETPLQEVGRLFGKPIDFFYYTFQQHSISRLITALEAPRGVGLDPIASENEAQTFIEGFNARIVPSSNPLEKINNLQLRTGAISLIDVQGQEQHVRVNGKGELVFNRGGEVTPYYEKVDPTRFNIDLYSEENRAELERNGIFLPELEPIEEDDVNGSTA